MAAKQQQDSAEQAEKASHEAKEAADQTKEAPDQTTREAPDHTAGEAPDHTAGEAPKHTAGEAADHTAGEAADHTAGEAADHTGEAPDRGTLPEQDAEHRALMQELANCMDSDGEERTTDTASPAPTVMSNVPRLGDKHAPMPPRDQPSLSASAIDKRIRRTFTPRVDGSLKVPERFYKDWLKKGEARLALHQIFASCGYCPVSH